VIRSTEVPPPSGPGGRAGPRGQSAGMTPERQTVSYKQVKSKTDGRSIRCWIAVEPEEQEPPEIK
jgi:hypothetical protein